MLPFGRWLATPPSAPTIQPPEQLKFRYPFRQGQAIKGWHVDSPIEPQGGFAKLEIEISPRPCQPCSVAAVSEFIVDRFQREPHRLSKPDVESGSCLDTSK